MCACCASLTRKGLRDLLAKIDFITLEVLDISNTPIGDKGVQEVISVLPVCAHLLMLLLLSVLLLL